MAMKHIRLHPSGHIVECQEGSAVLEALEAAGYALPNNCRAGACGECKVKVLSGTFDQGFVLDMALSQQERHEGYGLMCMAKPISDELVIDWGTEDAQPKLFPPRENQEFIVVDRLMRTPRILELRLRPLASPMRYWPGQYIMLGSPQSGIPPRSYSIANAPRPDGEISLQITRVDDGITSAWVHQHLNVGNTVTLSGPYGTFIGDPSVDAPVLCIAAGSGLAPVLALADAALRRGYSQPVTLLFSARTTHDLYESGLMAWWQAKHPGFRYIYTLTREQHEGLCGRVPQVLPSLFDDLSDFSIFIAGSPAFVENCVSAVKALGAKPRMIHSEGYFQQQRPVVAPISHMVSLQTPIS